MKQTYFNANSLKKKCNKYAQHTYPLKLQNCYRNGNGITTPPTYTPSPHTPQIHLHRELLCSTSFKESNNCFVSDHPPVFATVQTGFTGVLTQRHLQPYSLHSTTLWQTFNVSHHFQIKL